MMIGAAAAVAANPNITKNAIIDFAMTFLQFWVALPTWLRERQLPMSLKPGSPFWSPGSV